MVSPTTRSQLETTIDISTVKTILSTTTSSILTMIDHYTTHSEESTNLSELQIEITTTVSTAAQTTSELQRTTTVTTTTETTSALQITTLETTTTPITSSSVTYASTTINTHGQQHQQPLM